MDGSLTWSTNSCLVTSCDGTDANVKKINKYIFNREQKERPRNILLQNEPLKLCCKKQVQTSPKSIIHILVSILHSLTFLHSKMRSLKTNSSVLNHFLTKCALQFQSTFIGWNMHYSEYTEMETTIIGTIVSYL